MPESPVATAAPSGAAAGAPPVVLYVDDWLLVVDKPAGLLSVAGRGPAGEDCLHARLCRHWPDARVVHRLDMATSGLMVFARSPLAQSRLSRAFEERAVGKRYVAVVAGRPRAVEVRVDADHAPADGVAGGADGHTGGGRRARAFGGGAEPGDDGLADAPVGAEDRWTAIDLPLAPDWPARPRQMVDRAHGRPSLTWWRPIGPAPGPWGEGTRVALRPVTGRSHQLRVHLASIGHPIVGDPLYASAALERASSRLLLHAEQLSLPHPEDGWAMAWTCEAPF